MQEAPNEERKKDRKERLHRIQRHCVRGPAEGERGRGRVGVNDRREPQVGSLGKSVYGPHAPAAAATRSPGG